MITSSTGSPSSKYEHRHDCVTFEIQRKYKDMNGEKPVVPVTYENEKIKKKTAYLTSLCGPRSDLWAPFYGV